MPYSEDTLHQHVFEQENGNIVCINPAETLVFPYIEILSSIDAMQAKLMRDWMKNLAKDGRINPLFCEIVHYALRHKGAAHG